MTALVWLRQDLRLEDHPALRTAIERGDAVIPVYLWAPREESPWEPGGAVRWWLHHSLAALDAELRTRGSRLILRRTDDSGEELLRLAGETGATHVFWNRRYEPAVMARDARVKIRLRQAGLNCESFNGALLREPWEIKSGAGTPYQVFTAYQRRFLDLPDPAVPMAAPKAIQAPASWPTSSGIDALELLPRLTWYEGMAAQWQPGSAAALTRMNAFLRRDLADYAHHRDRPDLDGTSRLSPHLHFGEISARQAWHALRAKSASRGPPATRKREAADTAWRSSRFATELLWREFAHHLLYHFPETPDKPLRSSFGTFGWLNDRTTLQAWQRGLTGYPIVDAGMRQLWRTGWMHNRVRMVVASFLVKHLLVSWQHGSCWFWDTLVDADLASNTLGWQWSAGCGADAAPYFRIFNPTAQGRKFDPEGAYVKRFVPELAKLPARWIHEPWNAPAQVREQAGLTASSYPPPMVDHTEARQRALQVFAGMKSGSSCG